MEIPVIDFNNLEGENRAKTMALLHHACEKWGFFQIENHGINTKLMKKVKQLLNQHYEENLKEKFYKSDIVKRFDSQGNATNVDWETTFFIWHRMNSNDDKSNNISVELRKTMDECVDQLIKLAENLYELMSENLGLNKNYIKQTFVGNNKVPSVGTKVAIYLKCPWPELVKGLHEHTDAGGIILMLQDDQVPSLEFFKDREWIGIPPSKNNRISVNTGDQLEVISNGNYKSCLHRVMADKNESRLSIATFYNPNGKSVISPTEKLLYPNGFLFKDYLKLYSATKFADKGPRFESMKKMVEEH